jgi:hypothetical protein
MLVVLTSVDTKALQNMLAAAGPRAPVAIARALNRAGTPTRNAYLRSLKATLGLKAWRYEGGGKLGALLKRRTSTKSAHPGNLRYSFAGFGGGLPAKYYDPKETPAGATVNWLGRRVLLERSFYLGGLFPNRKVTKLTKRNVFERVGPGKWSSMKNVEVAQGPAVPEAMIQPGPTSTWLNHARARLGPELSHQLHAILSGNVSGSFGARR